MVSLKYALGKSIFMGVAMVGGVNFLNNVMAGDPTALDAIITSSGITGYFFTDSAQKEALQEKLIQELKGVYEQIKSATPYKRNK